MAYSNDSHKLSHNKARHSSIIVPITEKSRSPGPALYGRSDISLVKMSSPQYTIASKVERRTPNIPAPNFYDRSNYKPGKTAPSYSFGGRYLNRSPPMTILDYMRR